MKIDFISLIIGAVFGAIPSWFLTHVYYKKTSIDNNNQTLILKRHQEILMDELTENIEDEIEEAIDELQK